MFTLPLIFNNGHLFVKLEDKLWLYDTGAPTSFGAVDCLKFAGKQFHLSSTARLENYISGSSYRNFKFHVTQDQ